jgi:hypothetical protein
LLGDNAGQSPNDVATACTYQSKIATRVAVRLERAAIEHFALNDGEQLSL